MGLYPLLIDLLTHSAKFWLHLCNTGIDSIAKKAHIDSCSINKFQTWATLIRKLWIHFSLPEIWNNHGTLYRHKTIHILKINILANYDSLWSKMLNADHSKLRTYKLFKSKPGLEKYLISTNVLTRKEFTRLRISAHFLRIETGRHTVKKKPLKIKLV